MARTAEYVLASSSLALVERPVERGMSVIDNVNLVLLLSVHMEHLQSLNSSYVSELSG